MRTFGGQVVTIPVTTGTGEYDELGNELVDTESVDVGGCRHRPLSVSETPDWVTNIGTQVWKTTAPPDEAILALDTDSTIVVDEVAYQVIAGAQPFTNRSGAPFKVTVLSKVQDLPEAEEA
mgnify:CR=1 FL=1